MNRNDDFDPTLADWLHRQAPSQAPDRVLDAALERVATESQRRGLLLRLLGGSPMNTALRVAAVTAVIAVFLLIGFQPINLVPNVGQATPSPSASDSPIPTATATPEPSPTLPAGCVNPPNDILDLIDAQQSPEADPVACYGNEPLEFDAQWMNPGIPGCPMAPEPAWLTCSGWFLRPVGATGKVGVPELGIAIDPSITTFPAAGTTVRVTGHFDDPRAQTCRNTAELPDSSPEPVEDVIERCRRAFVVTEITER